MGFQAFFRDSKRGYKMSTWRTDLVVTEKIQKYLNYLHLILFNITVWIGYHSLIQEKLANLHKSCQIVWVRITNIMEIRKNYNSWKWWDRNPAQPVIIIHDILILFKIFTTHVISCYFPLGEASYYVMKFTLNFSF